MYNTAVSITQFVLSYFDKIFKDRLTISGEENIPKNHPIIYAANHFTRFETLLLPYVIHKKSGSIVKSLADRDLFVGVVKKYLDTMNVISTGNPKRNQIIISDLIHNKNNWMVYVEGSMIKSRETFATKKAFGKYSFSARTGSAVLSIKTEIARIELLKSHSSYHSHKVQENSSMIVPVTLSYSPIVPEENKLYRIAKRFIGKKKISNRMHEELLIESSILYGSKVHIHFGEPIDVHSTISKYYNRLSAIPLLRKSVKEDFTIKRFKDKLTYQVANKIYANVAISVSHVLSCIIFNLDENLEYNLEDIKLYCVYIIIEIKKQFPNLIVLNPDIMKDYLSPSFEDFDKTMRVMNKQNLVHITENNMVRVNVGRLKSSMSEHSVRLENIALVFKNEIAHNKEVVSFIANTFKREDISVIKSSVATHIHESDMAEFEIERSKYPEESVTARDCGAPIFLFNPSNKKGVALSHGYKSSPGEQRQLAEFLHANGYNVYVSRFTGHGTFHEAMRNTTYRDWIASYQKGVKAIMLSSQEVFLGGFSAGGLVALCAAFELTNKSDKNKLSGIISINSAFKISDIRFRFVKFAKFWSDILKEKSSGSIKDTPEYPDTNYDVNYLATMTQLSDLMKYTRSILPKVTPKIGVFYSDKDPIVSPDSAKVIADFAQKSVLKSYDCDSHIIVRDKRVQESLFADILKFIS